MNATYGFQSTMTAKPGLAAVGHSVGYGSASQFSREYRREFGITPSADAVRLRQQEPATA